MIKHILCWVLSKILLKWKAWKADLNDIPVKAVQISENLYVCEKDYSRIRKLSKEQLKELDDLYKKAINKFVENKDICRE